MALSEQDISRLKELHSFLAGSFKGASVGSLLMDEATQSLQRAINEAESGCGEGGNRTSIVAPFKGELVE